MSNRAKKPWGSATILPDRPQSAKSVPPAKSVSPRGTTKADKGGRDTNIITVSSLQFDPSQLKHLSALEANLKGNPVQHSGESAQLQTTAGSSITTQRVLAAPSAPLTEFESPGRTQEGCSEDSSQGAHQLNEVLDRHSEHCDGQHSSLDTLSDQDSKEITATNRKGNTMNISVTNRHNVVVDESVGGCTHYSEGDDKNAAAMQQSEEGFYKNLGQTDSSWQHMGRLDIDGMAEPYDDEYDSKSQNHFEDSESPTQNECDGFESFAKQRVPEAAYILAFGAAATAVSEVGMEVAVARPQRGSIHESSSSQSLPVASSITTTTAAAQEITPLISSTSSISKSSVCSAFKDNNLADTLVGIPPGKSAKNDSASKPFIKGVHPAGIGHRLPQGPAPFTGSAPSANMDATDNDAAEMLPAMHRPLQKRIELESSDFQGVKFPEVALVSVNVIDSLSVSLHYI